MGDFLHVSFPAIGEKNYIRSSASGIFDVEGRAATSDL